METPSNSLGRKRGAGWYAGSAFYTTTQPIVVIPVCSLPRIFEALPTPSPSPSVRLDVCVVFALLTSISFHRTISSSIGAAPVKVGEASSRANETYILTPGAGLVPPWDKMFFSRSLRRKQSHNIFFLFSIYSTVASVCGLGWHTLWINFFIYFLPSAKTNRIQWCKKNGFHPYRKWKGWKKYAGCAKESVKTNLIRQSRLGRYGDDHPGVNCWHPSQLVKIDQLYNQFIVLLAFNTFQNNTLLPLNAIGSWRTDWSYSFLHIVAMWLAYCCVSTLFASNERWQELTYTRRTCSQTSSQHL